MQIRQRLRVNNAVFVLSIIAVITVLWITAQRVNRAVEQNQLVDAIIAAAFERLAVRTDYIRTGSERARSQVLAENQKIDKLLGSASEKFTGSREKESVSTLIENQKSISRILQAVMANRENTGQEKRNATLSAEVEARLLTQLNARVYELVILTRKLQETSSAALVSVLRAAGGAGVLILLFVSGIIMINSVLINRTIVSRIGKLRDGASAIGKGNLDHRIGIKGDDEFAALSAEFDEMATKLRDSYRSLENEIEERKRAEEAVREARDRALWLARFPEQNPNPVIRTSTDGKVLYSNPASAKLDGWRCEVGQVLRSELLSLIKRAMAEKEEIQADVLLADRFYIVWVVPFPAEGYVNLYGRDITSRKRMEEELEQAHKELQKHANRLEAANRELESFSYSVSHDLRSPLRAIDGFTRMILNEQGENFDTETRRKFGIVQENARRMGQLIDDLLRLSRVGRANLNWSKIDMKGLVTEVLQEIRATEPEHKFTAEIGDLLKAQGDPTLVRQVVLNLLSNAVKFTRGKGDGYIKVGSFEEAGEKVYYIKDNGVGFDMKYYDKLFGVFQRLVSENQFEGTGVGLAIVQRIIQRHGGRVWAEGKMNEGATFYFTLP